jgi:hypothetical protein
MPRMGRLIPSRLDLSFRANGRGGVHTPIVTVFKIAGRDTNACPRFGPLMATTAQDFDDREVMADKGILERGES